METYKSNPQPAPANQVPPNNNLAWAILTTLLCCWPFGIPAIVNAAKVEKYWFAGYHEEAIHAANEAKKWSKISAGVAIAIWLLYILFFVILGIWSTSDFV